ncbi:uncharacterized protein LOC144138109 isoform X10 [Haemaphysalis longicornis]
MALSRPCSGIVQTLHKICYKGINVQCTLWAGLPSTSLASVSRHHVQLGCLALWHCPDPAQDLLQGQAAGPTLVLLIWMMDAWAGLRTGKQYLQKWQGRTDRFLFGASRWSDLCASHLDNGCLGWPEDRKAVSAKMARQN